MSDEFTISDPRFDADRHVYTAPLPDEEMDAMFADIAAVTVDENPGLIGRIRQRPTPVRVALGLAAAAAVSSTVILVHGLRGDLTADGSEGMMATLAVMALLGVGSMVVSLRSLDRSALGTYAWLFAGLSLLLPPFLSLVPGLWPGVPAPHMMPWESGCFWFGAVVASLTGASVLLLQRSSRMAAWRVLTAAASGGFAGFITQQLFCPANDTWHILTTHGLLGLVVSTLLLAGMQIKKRL